MSQMLGDYICVYVETNGIINNYSDDHRRTYISIKKTSFLLNTVKINAMIKALKMIEDNLENKRIGLSRQKSI
jgi:hypothetical protein